MVLQVRHTTPTTPAGPGFNTEITSAVRIQTKKNLTESADLAEVASVEVLVDDPSASLSFVTRQAIVLDETEAPANDRRVFTGYIARRALVRGTIGELIFPQGRVWRLECAEFNALIGWRIVRGEQSDRPQETVANRLLWLLSTTFLNGVDDLGLIDWPDPAFDIVMPPNDYEGQWGKAVLEDIAAQAGLGFFLHIDESVGDGGLAMFDFNTYTGYASALRLSNVASDIDLVTTFPISFDAEWSADGERIAPGMYLTGADGLTSYGYNPDTQHAFGNIVRDQVAPMPNVTTQAALDAARARLLTQHQEEEERLTCRVQLPAAKVNAIRKGHSIEVKLSHVPGRTDFTWWRVTDRAVSTPENASQDVYDLDLDLVPMLVASGCNDQDFRVAGAPQFVQYGGGRLAGFIYNGIGPNVFTLPFTPTPGNAVLAFLLHFSEAGTPGEVVGGTELGTEQTTLHNGAAGGTIRVWQCCPDGSNQVSIVNAGATTTCTAYFVEVTPYVVQSVQTRSTRVPPDAHDQSPGVDATPTAGSDVLIISFQMHGQKQTGSANAGTTVVTFSEWTPGVDTNPGIFIGYQRVTGASGSYLVGMNSLVGTEAGTSQAVIQVVLA